MNNIRTWLLLALVVLVAIGIGLYANELRRQADIRDAEHAAAVAAKNAERMEQIKYREQQVERDTELVKSSCHPNIKADPKARPGSPEWKEYHDCQPAQDQLAIDAGWLHILKTPLK